MHHFSVLSCLLRHTVVTADDLLKDLDVPDPCDPCSPLYCSTLPLPCKPGECLAGCFTLVLRISFVIDYICSQFQLSPLLFFIFVKLVIESSIAAYKQCCDSLSSERLRLFFSCFWIRNHIMIKDIYFIPVITFYLRFCLYSWFLLDCSVIYFFAWREVPTLKPSIKKVLIFQCVV